MVIYKLIIMNPVFVFKIYSVTATMTKILTMKINPNLVPLLDLTPIINLGVAQTLEANRQPAARMKRKLVLVTIIKTMMMKRRRKTMMTVMQKKRKMMPKMTVMRIMKRKRRRKRRRQNENHLPNQLEGIVEETA